jgi:hypothetical protein
VGAFEALAVAPAETTTDVAALAEAFAGGPCGTGFLHETTRNTARKGATRSNRRMLRRR